MNPLLTGKILKLVLLINSESVINNRNKNQYILKRAATRAALNSIIYLIL